MNIPEIDLSLSEIQTYLGAKVQAVHFVQQALILELYHFGQGMGQKLHLIMYAKAPNSAIFITSDVSKRVKSEQKPIYLFAKAHLLGATLSEITRDENFGRVVNLEFNTKDETIRVTQNLVPMAWNLQILVGNKEVSLNKPKEVPKFQGAFNSEKTVDPDQLESQKNKILGLIFAQQKKTLKIPSKEQGIKKLEKLKTNLLNDLETKKNLDHLEFAELLIKDPKQASLQFPQFYDAQKNIYVLQKEFFDKHKRNIEKIKRVEERLEEVELDIQGLKAMSDKEWESQQLNKQKLQLKSHITSKKPAIEARKLELGHDFVAYLGKSAKHNTELLRRAKPWHYWMHIKDHASAYVIIHCQKNKKISFSEVEKTLKWWASLSGAQNSYFQEQSKCSVLVTQCRYVRPVKGDKLGRVTYAHEQVFTIQL